MRFRLPLLLALVLGCPAPQLEDRDPGGEIHFTHLHAKDGFLHASTSFYSSEGQWQVSGAVHFDAERLFMGNEPIRHSSTGDPNLTIWSLEGEDIMAYASGYAVSLRPDDRVLRVLGLEGLGDPTEVSSTALPAGETSTRIDPGDGTRVVVPLNRETGNPQDPLVPVIRIYEVTSAGAMVARAEAAGVSCDDTFLNGDLLYCAVLQFSSPDPLRLAVYRINAQTGGLDLVTSAAPDGSVGWVGGFHLLDASRLAVWTVGSGRRLHVFDVGAGGVPAYAYSVVIDGNPDVYGVLPLSASGGVDRLLVPTSDGVKLLDVGPPSGGLASATTVASDPDRAQFISPFDPAQGLYTWSLGRLGMAVVKVEGNAITRVGSYYRKWGDQFGSYGVLSERKF